ncbi:MAG: CDP-diacylglycerol--serine O-phosphatidyltransferase [Bacteroidota bacterium]|jgi:CDP-diacylglycerol--serine O-phosphatidyltransferase
MLYFVRSMNQVKQHIPNALTSANLVFGCLAIMQALDGRLQQASYFIFAAAILDFFDGFVARALKAQSELGKQLDSLADVVSFGVAPGMIFYMFGSSCLATDGFCYVPYLSLLIPVFSALRLAKFNIDTRQTDRFIGLPTPANAMFMASLPFLPGMYGEVLDQVLKSELFLKLVPLISAYLLVAEIPLIALKFKSFSVSANLYRYALILVSCVSVLLFNAGGIAAAVIFYIVLSVIQNLTDKTKTV